MDASSNYGMWDNILVYSLTVTDEKCIGWNPNTSSQKRLGLRLQTYYIPFNLSFSNAVSIETTQH